MKKYFLLIGLFVIVFLGLGNYTVADCTSDCENDKDICLETESLSYCNVELNTCKKDCSTSANGTSTTSAGTSNPTPATPDGEKCGESKTCTSTQKCIDASKGECGECSSDEVCCGIKLNTTVPFIGNCLETNRQNKSSDLTEETAFPVLMSGLTRILVTVILIVSFVLIIIGGIMIATGNPSGGRSMIMKVVMGIAILGASGVILRLINPNFFG